jgi:hypothetical protein
MSKISPRLSGAGWKQSEAGCVAGGQPEDRSKYTILHNIPVFFKYASNIFQRRENYLCYNLPITVAVSYQNFKSFY